MMETYAIVNQKGGCGKSFTAASIAEKLSKRGLCIALDTDPQGNLSSIYAIKELRDKNTSASLYSSDAFISAYPASARYTLESEDRRVVENLFISTACEELTRRQKEAPSSSIFNIANAVRKAGDEYKYCVIDCPPGEGIAQEMALYAADYILIPITDGFSQSGALSLIGTINRINENRRTMPVVRFFMNAVSHANRKVTGPIKDAMLSMYPDNMSSVEVPYQQQASNAMTYLFPITTYSRIHKVKSKASIAHDLLLEELNEVPHA